MLSARAVLALGVSLALTVGVLAQPGAAPPRQAPTPTPLAVNLLAAVDDPGLVAELKLTDDQTKALVALRQAEWDMAYTTAPRKFTETAATRAAATDAALKKTLTPDQYKRAVQIAAQRALNLAWPDGGFTRPGGTAGSTARLLRSLSLSRVQSAVLNRHPELVDAFKLTAEQKQQLTPQTDPNDPRITFRTVTLTADQSAAAKEFVGPIYEGTLVTRRDPRARAVVVPGALSVTGSRDVRAEIKATDDQLKALTAAREKWARLQADARTDLSPKDAAAAAEALTAETEKALAATLAPAQLTRLNQLAFRDRWGNADIEVVAANEQLTKDLALTETQVTEVRALQAAYRTAAAAALEAGRPFADTEKAVNALIADRKAKAATLLTADQSAKLAALTGPAFTGNLLPGERRFGPIPAEVIRAGTFGHYINEFSLLATNRSIQDELKLTPDQVRKAAALRDQQREEVVFPDDIAEYPKAYAAQSKFVETELAKLLTADQAKRFREIMLQSRERPEDGSFMTGSRVLSAAAYPGVADAIQLTADQKAKLLAATAPADVLTADQKAAVARMLGEPFKGDFGLGFPKKGFATGPPTLQITRAAMFGRYSAELAQLAGNKSIQDELKLSDDQIKRAQAQLDENLAKFTLPFPGGGEANATEYNKVFAARSAAIEAALGKILTADQAKRFREIMLQSRQPRPVKGGPPVTAKAGFGTLTQSAASYPGVAEAIKLTDEQKTKLLAGTAAEQVLTADQQAAITKMLGEPFRGSFALPRPAATNRAFQLLILGSPSPDEALKLTPEQSKALAAARETYLTRIAQGPGGGGSPLSVLTGPLADFQKTLIPEQAKRLDQLAVQSSAATALLPVLTAPESGLNLTADQTAKLTVLNEDAIRLQQLLNRAVVTDPEQKLALRLRDQADDRMFAVLTDAQKAKWKELTGDPWPGLVKTIPSRFGTFGGGGFGGPIGGGGGFGPGPGGFER